MIVVKKNHTCHIGVDFQTDNLLDIQLQYLETA